MSESLTIAAAINYESVRRGMRLLAIGLMLAAYFRRWLKRIITVWFFAFIGGKS